MPKLRENGHHFHGEWSLCEKMARMWSYDVVTQG